VRSPQLYTELFASAGMNAVMVPMHVLPDRLSSPLKVWFVEQVDVADTDTMNRVSRALRTIQDL